MSFKIDGPVLGPISLTVGTTATEAKVGVSKLSERKGLIIQPINKSIYFGFDNTVTTSSGVKIDKGNIYRIDAEGRFLDIYLIAGSSGADVRIIEFA